MADTFNNEIIYKKYMNSCLDKGFTKRPDNIKLIYIRPSIKGSGINKSKSQNNQSTFNSQLNTQEIPNQVSSELVETKKSDPLDQSLLLCERGLRVITEEKSPLEFLENHSLPSPVGNKFLFPYSTKNADSRLGLAENKHELHSFSNENKDGKDNIKGNISLQSAENEDKKSSESSYQINFEEPYLHGSEKKMDEIKFKSGGIFAKKEDDSFIGNQSPELKASLRILKCLDESKDKKLVDLKKVARNQKDESNKSQPRDVKPKPVYKDKESKYNASDIIKQNNLNSNKIEEFKFSKPKERSKQSKKIGCLFFKCF